MITTSCRLRRIAAAVAAAAVLIGLPGCSDAGSAAPGAPEATPVQARDLGAYDAFVIASADNNILFADVYGVRFSPLSADRITADKRISSLGADAEHLIVAAADTDVDRLAAVTGDGALVPVPGLGRPFAYNPHVTDGVLFYEDIAGSEDREVNRYFRWDIDAQEESRLFRSGEQLDGITPIGKGSFVFAGTAGRADQEDSIVIRDPSGELAKYPVGGDTASMAVGARHVATTLVASGNNFGEKPADLVLIAISDGRQTRVPGLQAIAWTPDGTRLLARRTTSPTSSDLVLLDPAKPDQLNEVGSIPDLVIYSGTWVRNNP